LPVLPVAPNIWLLFFVLWLKMLNAVRKSLEFKQGNASVDWQDARKTSVTRHARQKRRHAYNATRTYW
jgi:hypothetical protein